MLAVRGLLPAYGTIPITRLAAPGWSTTVEQESEPTAWAPAAVAAMSLFHDVDSDGDSARALRYLDWSAEAESGIKHYAMAAHAARHPSGPILDVGCGAGHDLGLLNSAGLRAVGLDPSAQLLRTAAARAERRRGGLVRGTGEDLPFVTSSFSGCRIERVLIHVADPSLVLSEAVRCLRPGGLITVFEPDWHGFEVRTELGVLLSGWIAGLRNPGIGGALWDLLEEAGCDVRDRLEELSVWRSLKVLDAVIGLRESVQRAVAAGRIDEQGAGAWLDEQISRENDGTFNATIPKVLVVAVKR